MIDQLPRKITINTPLGPFEADYEPRATVGDLIEHVIAEKPLNRGDVFELAVDGTVIFNHSELGDIEFDDGLTFELIATGGAV